MAGGGTVVEIMTLPCRAAARITKNSCTDVTVAAEKNEAFFVFVSSMGRVLKWRWERVQEERLEPYPLTAQELIEFCSRRFKKVLWKTN